MAFVEDMSLYFADFGVPAIYGGQSATVIIDKPDSEVFDNQVIVGDATMTYVTGDLVGLKTGDVVTVDSIDYKVTHPPMALDDGKLMQAKVAEQ
jgi:hypothetical protein